MQPTFRPNDWCVFRIFADTLEIWALLQMNLNGADGSQRWRMACKGCSADTTKLVSLQHRQLVDDPMNSRVAACGEMKAARTPNAQSPKSATGHAGCKMQYSHFAFLAISSDVRQYSWRTLRCKCQSQNCLCSALIHRPARPAHLPVLRASPASWRGVGMAGATRRRSQRVSALAAIRSTPSM